MRIAFDPQIFYLQRFGGISRYFSELATALEDLGEDVAIFAPPGYNQHLAETTARQIDASMLARRYHRFPAFLRSHEIPFESPIIRAEARARMHVWRPDIVHQTYFHDKPYGPENVPNVVTVYDMIYELYPEQYPANDHTAARKKVAVGNADKVICISHSAARDLNRIYDVPMSKIEVVYLASRDLSVAGSDRPVDGPAARPYFLFVGNRGGYKNFSALVEAYSSGKDLSENFDLVAFGGGGFSPGELAMIEGFGLSGKVRQVGGGDGLLSTLYGGAHALVYPSLYEGFGLPPLEAMSTDCPVLSSNTSSMPEVIGDAALFFDPGSIESMVHALEEISHNDALRAGLIEKGKDRLSMFSWDRCARETLSVYKKML